MGTKIVRMSMPERKEILEQVGVDDATKGVPAGDFYPATFDIVKRLVDPPQFFKDNPEYSISTAINEGLLKGLEESVRLRKDGWLFKVALLAGVMGIDLDNDDVGTIIDGIIGASGAHGKLFESLIMLFTAEHTARRRSGADKEGRDE